MACYRPRRAFQAWPGAPVSFNPLPSRRTPLGELVAPRSVFLPCGHCLGCLSGKATEWARRCEHEALRHEVNCFVTLTYDDEHLPARGFLWPPHHTAFMKALRKEADRVGTAVQGSRCDGLHDGVRYFMCGEYGTKRGRPHYHYLLFNCGFADRELRSDSERLGESATLKKLWPHGLHAIGEVTGASANYIAQYSLAKQRETFVEKPLPFLRMSLKPGIGMPFLEQYGKDLQHGYLVTDGKKGRIPRGYTEKLKRLGSDLVEKINVARAVASLEESGEPDLDRLKAEEVIHTQAKALGERHNSGGEL